MTDPKAQPVRKGSFLKKFLLIVVILLVVLALAVWFGGPKYIASQAKTAIQTQFAEQYAGTASVGDSSYSWSDGLELKNLRIESPEGRPILEVASIKGDVALRKALSGSYDVKLVVDRPQVTIRENPDGTLELESMKKAKSSKESEKKDPKADEALPELSFDARVTGGSLVFIDRKGRESRFETLTAQAALPATDRPLDFQAKLTGTKTGSLELKGVLKLFSEGRFDAAKLAGDVDYVARGIDFAALAPIVSHFAGLSELTGRLEGQGTYALQPGPAVQGGGTIKVTGLRANGEAVGGRPIEVAAAELTDQLVVDDAGNGSQKIQLKLGNFLTAVIDSKTTTPLEDTGRAEGKATVKGDLAGMAANLGSLLRIKEGLSLKGALDLDLTFGMDLAHGSPTTTTADGKLAVANLEATDSTGRKLPVDRDALVKFEGLRFGGGALAAKSIEARMAGTTLNAAGEIDLEQKKVGPSTLVANADLDALGRQLSSFLDLPSVPKGRVTADLKIAGNGDRATSSGVVKATGFDLVDKDGQGIGPLDLDMDHRATIDLRAGQTSRIETMTLKSTFLDATMSGDIRDLGGDAMAADTRVTATLRPATMPAGLKTTLDESGFRLQPASWDGTITWARSTLGLKGKAQSEGLQRVSEKTGQVDLELGRFTADLNLTAVMTDGGKTMKGQLKTPDLPIVMIDEEGAKRGRLRDATVDFDLATSGEGASSLTRIDRLQLAGPFGQVGMTGELKGEGEAGSMDAVITMAAELESLIRDLGALGGIEAGTMAGRADGRLAIKGQGGRKVVKGPVTIKNLVARGTHGETNAPIEVREPELKLELDIATDSERGDYSFGATKITSQTITGTLGGEIRNTKNAPEMVNLKADFRYIPEKLGVLIGPWLPGQLVGTKAEEAHLVLNGQASEADFVSLMRNSQGQGSVGLSKLIIAGLGLDGTFGLDIKEGHLRSDSKLGVNGGSLDLTGDLSFLDDPNAHCTMEVGVVKARANSQMGPMLQFLNPLFALSSGGEGSLVQGFIDGHLKLDYAGPVTNELIDGGWDKLPKSRINGSGRLGLTDVAMSGTSLIGQLMGILGVSNPQNLVLQPIEFTIDQGRVHYARAVEMKLDGVSTLWNGSVGLDKSLDMTWDIPVTPHLLGKYPFLKAFQGENLSVPVGGSLSSPELRFDRMIADLGKKAIEREIKGRAGDAVGDALGGALGGLLGGDKEKQATDLLRSADASFDAGRSDQAATDYGRLVKEFNGTKVYRDNQARIDARAPKDAAPDDTAKKAPDPIGGLLGGLLGGNDEKKAEKLFKRAGEAFDANNMPDAKRQYDEIASKYAGTSVYKDNKAL
ncbi:MAG: DUF748 domain-containing protein, partial [Planctomycetes bacterium]|nr:DUF748 domain-containing protein [Planctomycetota bacterium]